jgi:hypothetical protein
MIFPKNHEQTTMHLQFKFYPFPAESARICHFQKKCMKTFSEPTQWLFVNLTWSSLLKKCMYLFLQHICGCCFAKKPIFRTRKMENGFFPINMKASSVNIVRASKMHVCVEYGHIFANYAMDVAKTTVIWPETLECS